MKQRKILLFIGTFVLIFLAFLKNQISEVHATESFSCSEVSDVPVSECQVLVDIYTVNSGTTTLGSKVGWGDALLNNFSDTTVCDWWGVTCADGHIGALAIYAVGLSALPESISMLTYLGNLNVLVNQLTTLPESFANLTGLYSFNVSYNQLSLLPESIVNLTNLTHLGLGGNPLTSLPESFGNLVNLVRLYLSESPLTSLPESFGNLTQLQLLSLYGTELTTLPESFGNLIHISSLNVTHNKFTSLPDSFGHLSGLTTLDLGYNLLTTLPNGLSGLVNLSDLGVYNNHLISLPDWIDVFTHLTYLSVNTNNLSSIPDSIGNMTGLTTLDLGANSLTSLPDTIGNLLNVDTLHLYSNQLVYLPDTMTGLTALEYLDASDNKLIMLPGELFTGMLHLSYLFLNTNCLYISGLSVQTLFDIDNITHTINGYGAQTVCNNNRFTSIAGDDEPINEPLVFTINYTQRTGASVLTGFVDIDVGSGVVSAPSNSGWTLIDTGVYEYIVPPTFSLSDQTITLFFTGVFAEGAQTGVEYHWTATLWSGYDNAPSDGSNFVDTLYYSWSDAPVIISAPSSGFSFGGGGSPLIENTPPSDTTIFIIPTIDIHSPNNEFPVLEAPPTAMVTSNNTPIVVNYPSVYNWAVSNSIMTQPLASAKLSLPMQREEAAHIIVNYVKNILHKDIPHNPACENYQDANNQTIQNICDLGIMGWSSKSPLTKFRPHDTLTTDEMKVIVNRYFAGVNSNRIMKIRKIDLINLLMMKQ